MHSFLQESALSLHLLFLFSRAVAPIRRGWVATGVHVHKLFQRPLREGYTWPSAAAVYPHREMHDTCQWRLFPPWRRYEVRRCWCPCTLEAGRSSYVGVVRHTQRQLFWPSGLILYLPGQGKCRERVRKIMGWEDEVRRGFKGWKETNKLSSLEPSKNLTCPYGSQAAWIGLSLPSRWGKKLVPHYLEQWEEKTHLQRMPSFVLLKTILIGIWQLNPARLVTLWSQIFLIWLVFKEELLYQSLIVAKVWCY